MGFLYRCVEVNMIIDTSALMAILKQEQDAKSLIVKIYTSTERSMSSATYVEFQATAFKRTGGHQKTKGIVDKLIQKLSIKIIPLSSNQALIARDAFYQYSSGKYGLNFGDCFSYALAKDLQQPLLFKGNDFSKTDIQIVS